MPSLLVALALVVAAAGCGDVERGSAGQAGEQEYEADALVLEDASHGPELCLGGVMESDPPQCEGVPVVNWDWGAVPWREESRGTTMASAHLRGTYDGEVFTLTAPPTRPDPADREPSEPTTFPPPCADPEVVDESHGVSEYEEAAPLLAELPELVATWVSNSGPGEGPFVVSVAVRPGSADEARRRIRTHYLGPLCLEERDQPTAQELSAIQDPLLELLGDEALFGGPDELRGVVKMTVVLETEEMRRAVVAEFGEGMVELESRLQPVDEG